MSEPPITPCARCGRRLSSRCRRRTCKECRRRLGALLAAALPAQGGSSQHCPGHLERLAAHEARIHATLDRLEPGWREVQAARRGGREASRR